MILALNTNTDLMSLSSACSPLPRAPLCCRAAASPCEQAAVCDGINPACPSNPWVRKQTHCPW